MTIDIPVTKTFPRSIEILRALGNEAEDLFDPDLELVFLLADLFEIEYVIGKATPKMLTFTNAETADIRDSGDKVRAGLNRVIETLRTAYVRAGGVLPEHS